MTSSRPSSSCPVEDVAERAQHRLEVLALVVGGHADDQAHARIIAAVATKLPSNAELAEHFELLADMLELDGADAFRLAAYRRAAARIRESAVPVAQLALDDKATRLSGIGSTIEAKIVEIRGDRRSGRARQAAGEAAARASSRSCTCPASARRPPASSATSLACETLDDLRAAAEQERLRELSRASAPRRRRRC